MPQSQPRPVPAESIQSVRFGKDANTLLISSCSSLPPEVGKCHVVLADLAHHRATAFEAPRGQSLNYAVMMRDGRIMAVRSTLARDKHGNSASEIVTFSSDDTQASIEHRSTTEIEYPRSTEKGIIFWSRRCESRKERYCEHNPMFLSRSDRTVRPVERKYGFAQIGPIFRWGGGTYATAAYSSEMLKSDGFKFLERNKFSSFWQLSASHPYGLQQVVPGLSMFAGAANGTSDLFLYAADDKGSGLYRQGKDGRERLTTVPETIDESGTAVLDFDVSPDGQKVIFLIQHVPDNGEMPIVRFTLFDVGSRKWNSLKLPNVRHVLKVL